MTESLVIILIATIINFSLGNLTTFSDEVKTDPKIIGGSAISIQQAPWQVSIRLKEFENKFFGIGHICGGSVISQRVVLTAAHCGLEINSDKLQQRSAKDFIIVMGSGYLYQKTNNTLIYNVLQLIVHENFSLDTMMNDVALMFFDGKIPLNHQTIRPINLNVNQLEAGTECSVSGWGKMRNGELSNVLMAVKIPIISTDSCQKSYGEIGKAMFCAGYLTGLADSCQGDSGGPLQCGKELGGIVSWGFECGKAMFPGVYANVSEYTNWIINKNKTFNYTKYGSGAKFIQEQSKLIVLSVFILNFLFPLN